MVCWGKLVSIEGTYKKNVIRLRAFNVWVSRTAFILNSIYLKYNSVQYHNDREYRITISQHTKILQYNFIETVHSMRRVILYSVVYDFSVSIYLVSHKWLRGSQCLLNNKFLIFKYFPTLLRKKPEEAL